MLFKNEQGIVVSFGKPEGKVSDENYRKMISIIPASSVGV